MNDNDNKPIKKATSKLTKRSPLPLSSQQLREEIIKASGVSLEEMAETFRLAVTRLQEAMSATKKTYHTFQGQVIQESEDRDWSVILKAIAEFTQLTGVEATKAQTQINIGDNKFIVQGVIFDMQNDVIDGLDHGTGHPGCIQF